MDISNFLLLFAKACLELVAIFGSVYLGVAVALRHNSSLITQDWWAIFMVITSVFIRIVIERYIN